VLRAANSRLLPGFLHRCGMLPQNCVVVSDLEAEEIKEKKRKGKKEK
jgi:hypothetical protein